MLLNKEIGRCAWNARFQYGTDALLAVYTNKVRLVPYCKHHVETYHDWMKDPV